MFSLMGNHFFVCIKALERRKEYINDESHDNDDDDDLTRELFCCCCCCRV